MKAIYYPAWDELELRDVPEPSPKPGEVLVRVAAVGICGSELHGFVTRAARRTPPTIMGHEFCGHVADVGPDVVGYQRGDWVGVSSVIACGRCEDCLDSNVHLCRTGEVFGMKRPGGFAEFCAAPFATLLPFPGTVSPVQGSLLEPLGRKLFVLGPAAPAAHTLKLAGNFLIASMLETLAEAFALLRKSSVDPARLLEIVNGGLFQSPVYENYGRLMIEQRFEPAGFALRLGLKDVRLVLRAADAVAAPLPIASLIRDRLLGALARGQGELDWSSLARVAAESAGLER